MTVPVESGELCLKYGCTLCCHGTKMPLTNLDVNRIVKLGYKVKCFAEKTDQYWRLKNVNGKCFFLEGNKCKIYEYRPYGCRLYPLVYDWNKHKVTLDDLCPHKEEFSPRIKDMRKLMFVLSLLREQLAKSSFRIKIYAKKSHNKFLRRIRQ